MDQEPLCKQTDKRHHWKTTIPLQTAPGELSVFCRCIDCGKTNWLEFAPEKFAEINKSPHNEGIFIGRI
jgi:hypothetical protein